MINTNNDVHNNDNNNNNNNNDNNNNNSNNSNNDDNNNNNDDDIFVDQPVNHTRGMMRSTSSLTLPVAAAATCAMGMGL